MLCGFNSQITRITEVFFIFFFQFIPKINSYFFFGLATRTSYTGITPVVPLNKLHVVLNIKANGSTLQALQLQ